MRRVFIVLLGFIFAAVLVGCNQSETTENAGLPEVNIGVMPDIESIPFIIAEKNGYFENEGVIANIKHFKSAQDRDSAFQSGQLDGMITDIVAVVFANEGGINQKIISKNQGDIKLLAGKDTGISSTQELKGKSVGVSTNTIMEYTLDKMLEADQVKPEEVNKIAIPQLPTRLEMLQGGKIEAAILPDPLAGLGVDNGAVILNSTDAMKNKAGAIAFTDKIIIENPEAIKAVFRAYNKAVDYLAEKPQEEYIDFLIQEQGFPEQVKDTIQLPKYHKAELPDAKIVADVVSWMQEKELINGNYEYKDLVDEIILR
ncbi:MAG: ABC transporter substrate-binding protein [Syntrophomonadaceae bacterium]|jgi:NitT/TauT family transport system substrate-binding protein